MTDSKGLVLRNTEKRKEPWLKPGLSLAEKDSGTNGICLSLRLYRPVYMYPEYHYCDFLKRYYCYAVPLLYQSKKIGTLAAFSEKKSLARETMVIIDLLRYQIESEYIKRNRVRLLNNGGDIKISENQKRILVLMARGLTDSAISVEMVLNFATIKYHKKAIFKKLDAGSSCEAVVKALKLNLLTLEEI